MPRKKKQTDQEAEIEDAQAVKSKGKRKGRPPGTKTSAPAKKKAKKTDPIFPSSDEGEIDKK